MGSVPDQAVNRLQRDYMELIREPLEYITAHPSEDNILEWHYVLKGRTLPYKGGLYHGIVLFPSDFPFKPPSIKMLTPNGRFHPNQNICLNISDFHPKSWSPLWTVKAILNGLYSFMLSEESTEGSVRMTSEQRQDLARKSWSFNLSDNKYCKLFPELVKESIKKSKNVLILKSEN